MDYMAEISQIANNILNDIEKIVRAKPDQKVTVQEGTRKLTIFYNEDEEELMFYEDKDYVSFLYEDDIYSLCSILEHLSE